MLSVILKHLLHLSEEEQGVMHGMKIVKLVMSVERVFQHFRLGMMRKGVGGG
jgi:hypothetical protein